MCYVEGHSLNDARMITTNASIWHLMLFFCKNGRYASEEVVLNLLRTKCLPVLLYGVEACPLGNRLTLRSLAPL